MFNSKLLQYLCCPQCKSGLTEEGAALVCGECGRKYEVRDGIPILADLSTLSPYVQGQVRYFERDAETRSAYRLAEWQKSFLRRSEANFQLREGEVLIDIGCGTGYMAVEMARKGLKVIAYDLTWQELVKLKGVVSEEGLGDNLFLVCGTAEALPFQDNTADYVTANAVLEHLPKEREAIREISRVCKNESGLMITVPLQLKYVSPLFWLYVWISDRKLGHLRRYSREMLANRFRRFGYTATKTYYPGHFEKALVIFLVVLGLGRESWERWGEQRDQRKEGRKYGAQNICVFFER